MSNIKKLYVKIITNIIYFYREARWLISRNDYRHMLEGLFAECPNMLKNSSELIEKLSSGLDKNKVCHIIASGESLNSTKSKINPAEDYIFGFNFAMQSGLIFDAYCLEVACNDCGENSKWSNMFRKLVPMSMRIPDNLFFKNAWMGTIDLEYIKSNYNSYFGVVKDRVIFGGYSASKIENLALSKMLLKKDHEFVRQNMTLVALILLCYFVGFKKIVLHGADFGGKYFFESEDCGFSFSFETPKSKQKEIDFYATAIPVIKEINEYFKSRHISLTVASSFGPLSEVLDVYHLDNNQASEK